MGRRVFSGIQPTGNVHIGNYFGAIKRWAENQEDGFNIFCIVDLHAITLEHDPKILKENTLATVAWLLAAGIDPEKCILFVQSHNMDHANLGWILNCNVSMGEMSRMTQYKEKSEKKQFVSVGLFDYPALMAADVLLYDITEVPVGDDQKQHVELMRDIALRFNSKYGETFTISEPVIPKTGARILSLTDPTKKMSKSDVNPNSRIQLLDTEDDIHKKISSATTDSGNEITYAKDKPGIANLMEMYSLATNKSIGEVENQFKGKQYGVFKKEVAEAIVALLIPLQKRYKNFRESSETKKILLHGVEKASAISNKKLKEVYDKLGFVEL